MTPVLNADDTQWICATEPVCTCTGQDYDCQCSCADDRCCQSCGAPMILIDTDTGHRVWPSITKGIAS